MNKKFMITMITAMFAGSSMYTNNGGGWGAFGGGLATGMIVSSAVNSGNRYVSPEESDRRATNDSARRIERQIKNHDVAIKKLNLNIDRINKRKDLSSDEKNRQIAIKQKEINERQAKRDDLQDSLSAL